MTASLQPSRRMPVLADAISGSKVRDLALVLGGAAFTGLAAQLALPIPGTPVPVTGQTFAVLLVGAGMGWQRGAAAMLVYLAAGVLGVPWFTAASSGWPLVTGGYIIGMVAAAAVVGSLAARGGDRKPARAALTMLLGNVTIYAFGLPWLMVATGVGFLQAAAVGVLPFLLGDAIKTAAAAGLLPAAWSLLRRR